MKIAVILFVCIGLYGNGFAQYKVKGYVLREGLDTIWGTVTIPIVKEELDLVSLYKTVAFDDGTGKMKKFRPKDIMGFGIIDDDITSDYVTVNRDHNPFFVKKLVDGYIDLLEINLDASQRTIPFVKDAPGNKAYVTVYFFRKAADSLHTLEIDPITYSIVKRDLTKLSEILPELSINATTLTIPDLAILIREYNKKLEHSPK